MSSHSGGFLFCLCPTHIQNAWEMARAEVVYHYNSHFDFCKKKFNVPLKAHFSDCFTACNFYSSCCLFQAKKHFFLISLCKSTKYSMNVFTFIFNKVSLKWAADIIWVFCPNNMMTNSCFQTGFFYSLCQFIQKLVNVICEMCPEDSTVAMDMTTLILFFHKRAEKQFHVQVVPPRFTAVII